MKVVYLHFVAYILTIISSILKIENGRIFRFSYKLNTSNHLRMNLCFMAFLIYDEHCFQAKVFIHTILTK